MIGDKREQGIPLLNHLAANGWVGFNANYRLSPGATFPDHLVDVKRAIAWIRDHADDHDIDPARGDVGEQPLQRRVRLDDSLAQSVQ